MWGRGGNSFLSPSFIMHIYVPRIGEVVLGGINFVLMIPGYHVTPPIDDWLVHHQIDSLKTWVRKAQAREPFSYLPPSNELIARATTREL